MKRWLVSGVAVLVSTSFALAGEVYWDNFRDGYDADTRFTSERNTQHSMGFSSASWAVDDFSVPLDFPELGEDQGIGFNLTSVEWIGARQLDGDRLGYDRLDWGIFTRTQDPLTMEFDFQPLALDGGGLALFTDQMIGSDWVIAEELGDTTDGQESVYRGRLETDIPLDVETEYWVGVRLVGNDGNGDMGSAGRHFIASGSGESLYPNADSAFRFDPPRGGDPWQPIVNPISGQEFEAAYKLGFTVIPEPASLALLSLAGLVCLRRR